MSCGILDEILQQKENKWLKTKESEKSMDFS